jgi:hypothetical protein
MLFRVPQALHPEARSSGMGYDAARAFGPGTLDADAHQVIGFNKSSDAALAAEGRQHGIYFAERFKSFPGNCSPRLETHRKHFANGLRKIYTGARCELYLPRVRPDFRILEADG